MANKKKNAAKQQFPCRQHGYISPKVGEPIVMLAAHVPLSLAQQAADRARELGHRSKQQYLLSLVKADLTAAHDAAATKPDKSESTAVPRSSATPLPH